MHSDRGGCSAPSHLCGAFGSRCICRCSAAAFFLLMTVPYFVVSKSRYGMVEWRFIYLCTYITALLGHSLFDPSWESRWNNFSTGYDKQERVDEPSPAAAALDFDIWCSARHKVITCIAPTKLIASLIKTFIAAGALDIRHAVGPQPIISICTIRSPIRKGRATKSRRHLPHQIVIVEIQYLQIGQLRQG